MKARFTLTLFGLLAAAAPTWAGPEHIEGISDAGSLPGGAQETGGSGTLGRISGQLGGLSEFVGGDFEDMYVIFIKDPAGFAATTTIECDGVTTFDSRLYLFDMDGIGLLGNDNTAPPGSCMADGLSFGSTLLNAATDGSGAALTEPGLYLLAITVTPRAPFSMDGSIFGFKSDTEISGPDGPGGGDPIVSWEPALGACCISGKIGFECSIGTESDCYNQKGDYLGDGSTCEDSPCGPPTGACCIDGGECIVATFLDCNEQLLGEYLGDGTDCDPNPCAPPVGACCVSSGCLETTAADCKLMGGFYAGDGISCDSNPCGFFGPPGPGPLPGQYSIVLNGVSFASPPTGGCCLAGGTCMMLTAADCAAQAGEYRGDYSVCPDPGGPDACPVCVERTLIIKQGACPAPVNPNSNGVVPMLLVGEADFDVTSVDYSSLQLSLCEGGPSIAPHTIKVKDLNHPFDGDVTCDGPCACNSDQSSDGIDDLELKFKTNDLVKQLGLSYTDGVVVLELRGTLTDGSPFCARDCVTIMPPANVQQTNVSVQATIGDTFVQVAPLDLNVDSDGFASFSRSYYPGTNIKLTAPSHSEGWRFKHWLVNGVPQPLWQHGLEVAVSDNMTVRAIYHVRGGGS